MSTPRSSRAFVAAAEALGWVTVALLAWGGFCVQQGTATLAVVDVGLIGAPWLLLLGTGVLAGALRRLEDVPILRRAHALSRAAAAHPFLALSAISGAYCAVLLFHGFRAYAVHSAGAYDLGIFDQVVWATLHGAPLRSSLKGDVSILGDHFSPILALLAPAYLLWDDARCLLLLQTLAIAAGIVPAYLLARRRFGAGPLSIVWAAAYLAYAPTRNVNSYHFHPVALALPLLLSAAWCLERGRRTWFVVALLLASACQENVPLVVAGWGAALLVSRPRRPALGAAMAAGGLAAFLILVLLVIPRFARAESFSYLSRYHQLGGGVGEILLTLLSRPWLLVKALVWPPPKLEYLLRTFLPFAFLPFAPGGRRWLLPLAPVLLQNTLSAYPPMYSVAFQYTAPMTPFVLLGAMDGARTLLDRVTPLSRFPVTGRRIALALAVGLVTAGGESQVWQARQLRWDPRFARIEPVLASIPRSASVSAQAGVFSHVSHRHHVYLFPDRVGVADFVVLDRAGFLYSWQLSRAEYRREIEALPGLGYALVRAQDGFLLFRKTR